MPSHSQNETEVWLFTLCHTGCSNWKLSKVNLKHILTLPTLGQKWIDFVLQPFNLNNFQSECPVKCNHDSWEVPKIKDLYLVLLILWPCFLCKIEIIENCFIGLQSYFQSLTKKKELFRCFSKSTFDSLIDKTNLRHHRPIFLSKTISAICRKWP